MKVPHPLLNQIFELQPDGTVRVDDLDAGTCGFFDRSGRSVSGELRYADPQLLLWVAGAMHRAQGR
ncbi:MAG TPA: hypothetical protein VGI44_10245 [Acidimicrobiales bacterium]|jgi:hypothetical protein